MVGKIANLNALVHGARKASAVPVAMAAASKVKEAPAATGGHQPAPIPAKTDRARLTAGVLGLLLDVQVSVGHTDQGRHLGHAHKKPKPQPTPVPAPAPAPTPLVTRDDPAPATFLGRVLDSIHERPESQFSSEPFSQRDRPVSPSPAALQAMGGVFYTAGAFRPVQAMAMRTVHQGQAALSLLQAGALGVNRLI